MITRVLVDSATVPGGGELRLFRRGSDYAIMAGGTELMGTRSTGSEAALAILSGDRLRDRPRSQTLIGGLGMGFTLRSALQVLGPTAHVTVAEIVPAVIEWARGPLRDIFAGCLEDPRLTLLEGDVALLIEAARESYDAILLDVDNGPQGLTRAGNNWLYTSKGLLAARRALRPGGHLGVWSAQPDVGFKHRLATAGWSVEPISSRSGRQGRGARHTIWVATRPH